MNEIHVKSQKEFDGIPENYNGKIIIDSGKIIAYSDCFIEARNNSYVEAWDNCSVIAKDNSFVVAWDRTSVVARDKSTVEAMDNTTVEAENNSFVAAYDNSYVVARGNSSVVTRDKSSAELWHHSSAVSWDSSTVNARCDSSVEAWGNSSVMAWDKVSVVAKGNSFVTALGNSSVEAWGNSQVLNKTRASKITVFENARIICAPNDIYKFMDFYGIKHTENTAVFYKAVHKDEKGYHSNHNKNFRYNIGETILNECNEDVNETCGVGIHISYLNWALSFGRCFENLAILELEVPIDKIIVPKNTVGKVRTSEVKVLREVPLEECGVYGKILAKGQEHHRYA